MNKEEKDALIRCRVERAVESLKAAEVMFHNSFYIPAMNRIYYSMFYAVQSLLILHGKSFTKHGQVKGYFNKEFIKSGVLPKDFGQLFNTVFEYRQKFDYVDLIVPEKENILHYLTEAKNLCRE